MEGINQSIKETVRVLDKKGLGARLKALVKETDDPQCPENQSQVPEGFKDTQHQKTLEEWEKPDLNESEEFELSEEDKENQGYSSENIAEEDQEGGLGGTFTNEAGNLLQDELGTLFQNACEIIEDAEEVDKGSTYQFDATVDLHTAMSNFLNWISQTSGIRYRLASESNKKLLIVKEPSSGNQTDSQESDDDSDDQSEKEDSVKEDPVEPQEEEKPAEVRKCRASGRHAETIISRARVYDTNVEVAVGFLQKRVRIPSKYRTEKPLEIRLDTPGFNTGSLQEWFYLHPDSNFLDFLIHAFKMRGEYYYVSSLYDLGKWYTVD